MANAMKLKMINMEKVRTALKSKQAFTKNTLAAVTGLSVATCGNILREMEQNDEVFEIENAESTGGRPSKQFMYNKNFAYVLTLYIRKEGDERLVFYSVANMFNEKVSECYLEYKSIKTLDDIVEKLVNGYPDIKVMIIGVPGVVKDGRIGICDISDLRNLNIRKYFENKFDIKVEVINDVNCTALGYYSRSLFSESESLAYIYYPALGDPGAGIIIDGKVFLGASNFAGEVSYLPHYIFNDKSVDIEFMVSKFVEKAFRTVSAIISIINPKAIVLSGFQLNDKIIFEIKKLLKEYFPLDCLPEIIFEEDIHENYVCGLTALAFEQLTYKFNI